MQVKTNQAFLHQHGFLHQHASIFGYLEAGNYNIARGDARYNVFDVGNKYFDNVYKRITYTMNINTLKQNNIQCIYLLCLS